MESYHQHSCMNCDFEGHMIMDSDNRKKCPECAFLHPADLEVSEERQEEINLESNEKKSGTELGASIGELTDRL